MKLPLMKPNQKILLILILFISLASLTNAVISGNTIFSRSQTQAFSGTPSPTINITYENFINVVSTNSIVRALPKDAEVLIRFYNFKSGQRQFEKSYLITDRIIETNRETAEVIIFLDSKYLSDLTNKNFCSAIKRANQNSHLGFETSLSKTKLAWKYRALLNYRDCF
jgi:hypothetical protein